MIADFGFTPLGEVANRASAGVAGAQTYRETLAELQETNAT
jgi:hypothetical protein